MGLARPLARVPMVRGPWCVAISHSPARQAEIRVPGCENTCRQNVRIWVPNPWGGSQSMTKAPRRSIPPVAQTSNPLKNSTSTWRATFGHATAAKDGSCHGRCAHPDCWTRWSRSHTNRHRRRGRCSCLLRRSRHIGPEDRSWPPDIDSSATSHMSHARKKHLGKGTIRRSAAQHIVKNCGGRGEAAHSWPWMRVLGPNS